MVTETDAPGIDVGDIGMRDDKAEEEREETVEHSDDNCGDDNDNNSDEVFNSNVGDNDYDRLVIMKMKMKMVYCMLL